MTIDKVHLGDILRGPMELKATQRQVSAAAMAVPMVGGALAHRETLRASCGQVEWPGNCCEDSMR